MLVRAGLAMAVLGFASAAFADGSMKTARSRSGTGTTTGASGDEENQSVSATTEQSETGNPTTTERHLGSGPALSLEHRFTFDVDYEAHAMLVQNNLVGNGAETFFNYLYADASYYITPNDSLTVYVGVYGYALQDPGEDAGWRSDDDFLKYDHHFGLPWQLGLDLAAYVTAPFSFASEKMGLVTAPEVKVTLARTFGKYVTVKLQGFGQYYWEQYTTAQGGSLPNPYARFGTIANVEVALPWHKWLSLGVLAETDWFGLYAPNGSPNGVVSNTGAVAPSPYYGLETNPTFTGQPWQQEYGFEVYVNYEVPKRILGIVPSFQVAYAQGEASAGFTSDLVDGVSSVYLFYPEMSEVFGAVTLKY